MKSDLFKDNNVDYSPSTLKRLSSDRILLIVCAGIAAFCDGYGDRRAFAVCGCSVF